MRNAYWELVYAYGALQAAERSLELAAKLVTDNKSRVEIGTMAPIDVVQAQAEEATRRQAVVNAQATLRNNELALKRLIVGGTEDEVWRSTIFPTDRPASTQAAVDVEAAVRNALQNRTDIETTRKSIETSDVQLRSFVNQTMPQLNLIADYRLNGRGGLEIERDRITAEHPEHPSPAATSMRCERSAPSTRRRGTSGWSSLADRHQRRRGQRRPPARPPPPDRNAGQVDRAADRDRE